MRTFYIYSVNSKGEILNAVYGIKEKSRLDALKKQINIEKIYWNGNTPYGVMFTGSKEKIFAKLQ